MADAKTFRVNHSGGCDDVRVVPTETGLLSSPDLILYCGISEIGSVKKWESVESTIRGHFSGVSSIREI